MYKRQVDGLIDANSNGLDDRIESTPLAIPNTDESFENTNGLTNLPNYIDIDSDSDGIDDTREGYSTADYSFPTLLTDTDSDGIIDFWDVSTFATPITPYDRDSDDIPDYLDSDSDNDGVTDLIEGNDADADGIVDVALSGVDADNNGLDDALDGLCGQQTVYSLASSYAEENNSTGSIDLGSTDLELITDGTTNQTVGIRFTNLAVDQGANVTSAFVQFETDELSADPITITIQGELSTNASAFSTTANDVTTRTRTVASLSWSPGNWTQLNETGTEQKTVDISSIINEIVGQGGWANGNSLVLMFSGPVGNTRTAENDPLLIINTEFNATPTLSFTAGDYAEEDNGGGPIDLTSSDLELPNDGGTNQTVGVLFAGVTLDQGQVVTSAYMQFEADEVRTGTVNLSIEGELASSAAVYDEDDDDNVSTRSTTTATAIAWSPTDWNTIGEAGAPQQTPDITTLVQEIVNQTGWSNGNNMSFVITGTAVSGTDRRTAETDPELVIQTSASFTICASSVAHQDFNNDGEDDFRDIDDDGDGIPTASEIPDDDGSGTPDYLEFDGDECGIGFIRIGYTDDYTNSVASDNGVTAAGNITGAIDGTRARFDTDDDELVLDVGSIYPAGTKYVITWRERSGETGTAEIVLAESDDNSVFSGRQANPTTDATTYFNDTITSQFDFRYLRFRLENSASSTDYEVDAVGVLESICLSDADDDGIADAFDIDDDNDGVLDVTELNNCSSTGYADNVILATGVANPTRATGAINGDFAQVNSGDVLTLDLTDIVPNGEYLSLRMARENNNRILVETSSDDITYVNGVTYGNTSADEDMPTVSQFYSLLYAVSANSRYVRFTQEAGSTIIDAVLYEPQCTSVDTDGDGIDDNLDLDSDNDGVPDIQEAGGAANDTDLDGRVDDPTDTDEDGWADTFDSDNGGTALTDGDKDGDGFGNRIDLDADDDGIADIIEAGGVDSDNDGQVDSSTDTDNDGFADTFDNDNAGTPLPIEDEDGDGIENYLDLDSDSDGITDNVEGQTTLAFLAPLGSDGDNDGWDDRYDSDNGGTAITLSNNEGFGNPDYLDDDSDGDGLLDWIEGFDDNNTDDALDDLRARATTFETAAGDPGFYVNTDDTDADNIPDWLEDDDGDNVPNFLDPDNANYHDTDNDGIIDLYDTDNFGAVSNTPDGNGDGEYDFRDIDNQISLPIVLEYFNAKKVGEFVQLDWATLTEINNDYFTVERSINGVEFEDLLYENGAGNSQQRITYQRFDYSPQIGENYYRLKQTDYDGTSALSQIEVVEFEGALMQLKLFPNPSKGINLFIQMDRLKAGNYNVNISNSKGQNVMKTQFVIQSEVNQFQKELLDGVQLTPGTYILEFSNTKNREAYQFIVY